MRKRNMAARVVKLMTQLYVLSLAVGLTGTQGSGDGTCGTPPTLANAAWEVQDQTYAAGTLMMYQCKEGFYPTLDSTTGVLTCDVSSLTWTGNTFSCAAVDACNSSPCQFGGTCEADSTSSLGYRCLCTPSYTGAFCETGLSGNPVIFFVTIRSYDEYTSAMSDPTSTDFALVQARLEYEVAQLFAHIVTSDGTELKRSLTFQGLKLISITPGSLITHSEASFDPLVPDSAPQLQAALRDAVKHLKNDNPNDPLYDIDTNYVFVNSGPDEDNSSKVLPVWILLGLLGLLIIILLVLILAWRYRRQKKQYNERTLSEEEDESFSQSSTFLSSRLGYRLAQKQSYFWRDQPADFSGNLEAATLSAASVDSEEFPTYRRTNRNFELGTERNSRYDWAALGGHGGVNMLNGGQVGTNWRNMSREYFH